MATERQIAANRLNAARSSGPKTLEGKARSRANATKHGLAGASELVEPVASAAFSERRAKWGAEYRPVGEAAGWALDRAVAASLRIEQCERAAEEIAREARERAALAWDQDRAVEAATVAGRLGRDPVLASRQLQATRAGAEILVDAWLGLLAGLEAGEDWSESEASKALDLLGVAADLRSGRTLIDPEPGADLRAFRRSLALEEVERLIETIEEALGPLEAMERRAAIQGDLALLAPASRLVLRYERDAWRRYRESIRQLGEPIPSTVEGVPASTGEGSRPEVAEKSPAAPAASIAESPSRLDEWEAMEREDDTAWFDDLERRVEAGCDRRRNEPDLSGSRGGVLVGSGGRVG